jgi:hypothetical protein
MPAKKDDYIAELLEPMLKKRLFVALSKAVRPPEEMLPFVAEHLDRSSTLGTSGRSDDDHLEFLNQQLSVGVTLPLFLVRSGI